jgi:hypothetical protein
MMDFVQDRTNTIIERKKKSPMKYPGFFAGAVLEETVLQIVVLLPYFSIQTLRRQVSIFRDQIQDLKRHCSYVSSTVMKRQVYDLNYATKSQGLCYTL